MVSGTRVPQGTRLNPRRTFEVCEGMVIQDAINAAAAQVPAPSAAAPWTVLVYSGVYAEEIVMAAHVNLRGVDKESCILDNAHVTLVTMAAGCCVSGLTLNVTSDITASGNGIDLNDAACTIEDINLILNRTAGLYATGIIEDTGATARTIYLRNVRCRMTARPRAGDGLCPVVVCSSVLYIVPCLVCFQNRKRTNARRPPRHRLHPAKTEEPPITHSSARLLCVRLRP